MPFHRLSAPSYFGGLPGGYDYINDPATNGDAGTGAAADGKKGSGVNAGTYFISFGEDATSNDLNRPAKALAQNTDALDDILRRDLAITNRTSDVTAGSPVSSIVIAGQVYVGDFGVANTQATRDSLVSILDGSDNEIVVGSQKVQASLIHDGASANVVGAQTSGFFNTVTVALNVAVPAGVTYRVYYGSRSNLATLPKDAFTSIKIRGAQEVDAAIEILLRDLHSSVAGTNWNDAWLASINSLARTGLDGRYRLTTADPGATPAVNVAGNGGTIFRDGPAPAISYPTYDLSAVGTVGVSHYPDPILAAWRMRRAAPAVATNYDSKYGGDVGLYQESSYHNYVDAAEVAYNHISGPLLLETIPRALTASALSAHVVSTRINPVGVGSVNPAAGTSVDARRTISLASGDYIRHTSGRIAFRKNDLLEVIDNVTGIPVGTFRLDTILTDTTATLKTVTGAMPPLGPSGAAAAARFRWIQPVVSIGGQARTAMADAYGMSSMFVAQPGLITDGYDAENIGVAAIMLSALRQRDLGATNELLFTAMAWGGYDTSGAFSLLGTLLGDGGITTTGGRQSLNQLSRRTKTFTIPNGGTPTFTVNPVIDGTSVTLRATVDVNTPTVVTFALNTGSGYAPQGGDELDITVVTRYGTSQAVTFTWPANFYFSGTDGVVPPVNTVSAGVHFVTQLRFNYKADVPVPGWYATRTDY